MVTLLAVHRRQIEAKYSDYGRPDQRKTRRATAAGILIVFSYTHEA